MKRAALFILCLALFSLACLTTVQTPVANPTAAPASTQVLVPAGAQDPKQDTATPEAKLCAIPQGCCAMISADEALHLRESASETSEHLAFMRNGEVLRLISTANPDWWLVQRGELVGYARAKYLQEAKCGNNILDTQRIRK